MTDAPEPSAAVPAPTNGKGDRVLLAVFWAWALLLVVATLAQLFKWQGVLDVLDVKRWFSR